MKKIFVILCVLFSQIPGAMAIKVFQECDGCRMCAAWSGTKCINCVPMDDYCEDIYNQICDENSIYFPDKSGNNKCGNPCNEHQYYTTSKCEDCPEYASISNTSNTDDCRPYIGNGDGYTLEEQKYLCYVHTADYWEGKGKGKTYCQYSNVKGNFVIRRNGGLAEEENACYYNDD